MTAQLPRVAVLGTGAMATAVATLVAAADTEVLVWGRDPGHVEWVLQDVHDDAPGAQVRAVASLREAVQDADVVVPAVPWGEPLAAVLGAVDDLLPGRVVLDVSNPFDLTPLGPKVAMYVPGGSAGAAAVALLPAGTGYLHTLTHVRADHVVAGARVGAVLPYVSGVIGGAAANGAGAEPIMERTLGLLAATGWDPLRVGGIAEADLVEADGPWGVAVGAAGTGLLTRDEAAAAGVLP